MFDFTISQNPTILGRSKPTYPGYPLYPGPNSRQPGIGLHGLVAHSSHCLANVLAVSEPAKRDPRTSDVPYQMVLDLYQRKIRKIHLVVMEGSLSLCAVIQSPVNPTKSLILMLKSR